MAICRTIILDEMGYVPFNTDGAELFFKLISEWYEEKSLIITTNLEFSQWNHIFGDSRLAVELVDRVIHHAHILNFIGASSTIKMVNFLKIVIKRFYLINH